jgi:7-carboxy-7-deazaguanine synthase
VSLRISEIYPSIQGEGSHVGEPTVFIRFAGCNLRCPGWPCDTQHAIDPSRYRHEWKHLEATEICSKVHDICRTYPGITNVCWTGGEPFLRSESALERLNYALVLSDYTVECFSNGTIEYPDWALAHIDFTVDWKLPGSGEDLKSASMLPRWWTCEKNIRRLWKQNDSVKFTVANRADFDIAVQRWKMLLEKHSLTNLRVYCGAVWGKVSEADVASWILEAGVPWRLNVQTHNHIWNREQRGI